jgi:hypothetical protein
MIKARIADITALDVNAVVLASAPAARAGDLRLFFGRRAQRLFGGARLTLASRQLYA